MSASDDNPGAKKKPKEDFFKPPVDAELSERFHKELIKHIAQTCTSFQQYGKSFQRVIDVLTEIYRIWNLFHICKICILNFSFSSRISRKWNPFLFLFSKVENHLKNFSFSSRTLRNEIPFSFSSRNWRIFFQISLSLLDWTFLPLVAQCFDTSRSFIPLRWN